MVSEAGVKGDPGLVGDTGSMGEASWVGEAGLSGGGGGAFSPDRAGALRPWRRPFSWMFSLSRAVFWREGKESGHSRTNTPQSHLSEIGRASCRERVSSPV